MKPYIKALIFLLILTVLDILLRKGFIAFMFGSLFPQQVLSFSLYLMFAFLAWYLTKRFIKSDGQKLTDLGISMDSKNVKDFLVGLVVGIVLWGVVSIVQSYTANFSWVLRPIPILHNLLYGLIIIFIADLGTELFTRGYPLTRFEISFGSKMAILIMVVIVWLKSFTLEFGTELLLYAMLIPALHTVFFSIIYFKTRRLGGAVGVHTGANFITISIFDLRETQEGLTIPSGIFQPNIVLEESVIPALQLPMVIVAVIFSVGLYIWWNPKKSQ